ncbi:hypothetical protein ACOME3_008122 [Neoechinorhynchus agilis]
MHSHIAIFLVAVIVTADCISEIKFRRWTRNVNEESLQDSSSVDAHLLRNKRKDDQSNENASLSDVSQSHELTSQPQKAAHDLNELATDGSPMIVFEKTGGGVLRMPSKVTSESASGKINPLLENLFEETSTEEMSDTQVEKGTYLLLELLFDVVRYMRTVRLMEIALMNKYKETLNVTEEDTGDIVEFLTSAIIPSPLIIEEIDLTTNDTESVKTDFAPTVESESPSDAFITTKA